MNLLENIRFALNISLLFEIVLFVTGVDCILSSANVTGSFCTTGSIVVFHVYLLCIILCMFGYYTWNTEGIVDKHVNASDSDRRHLVIVKDAENVYETAMVYLVTKASAILLFFWLHTLLTSGDVKSSETYVLTINTSLSIITMIIWVNAWMGVNKFTQ